MAYLWSRGPDDSMLRIGLREGSTVGVYELQERLRKVLPEKVGAWFRTELASLGLSAGDIEQRLDDLVFAFEPGDLISETMSLGAPAPIEVVVSGRSLADSSDYMDRLRREFAAIQSLRDVQVQQSLHYPTVQVALDRERAGLSGVTARDVGESLIAATYSSRYTSRNFWRDDASGNSYQVQVEVPQPQMTSSNDVALVPLTPQAQAKGSRMPAQVDTPSNPLAPLLVGDVARVLRSEMPGEVDRYNMRRFLSLTANIEGEDLGRTIDRIDAAIARAGRPPRGIEVELRGQVKPMKQMFQSLEIGLAVAVLVILIMLTAYFQSPRLAVTAVATVPGVLCGVVLALWATRTTLNIESFMEAIMAVGVAVSNAIMLVSFADRHRLEEGMPADRAAITAAKGRLRPIIMTGCAMISGMIPMSLALEKGSEQNAPLGRAVIGGMALATVATLLVLPAVFSLLLGRARASPLRSTPTTPPAPTTTRSTSHPGRNQDQNRRTHPMPTPDRAREPRTGTLAALAFLLAAGCGRSESAKDPAMGKDAVDGLGKTAGITIVQPQQRDIRMMVVQPGSIQAFEVTPIYSRISGYVDKYRFNIGDHVKTGDILLDMWIPDVVEQLAQKTAEAKKAEVEIRVTESNAPRCRGSQARDGRHASSRPLAGVKRAQASYTRWESEYKRLVTLVNNRVLDVQVRDETFRQFEEAAAAREQAAAAVSESNSARDQAAADLERARVDVEAARATLLVAQAEQRLAQVNVDYGRIKAPYDGVLTQRNVSPGDFLEPGGGSRDVPLFVLEQIDPVRVFVGVPELRLLLRPRA